MQEGTERTALERNIIDHDVLTAILKRELDSIAFDLTSNTKRINELQRILEVGTVLKFVDGGHSILSWAAGVGNEDIVRLLLKRGAHTALGEDALLTWCTTIIQVVFRNSLERRGFSLSSYQSVSVILPAKCSIPQMRRDGKGVRGADDISY